MSAEKMGRERGCETEKRKLSCPEIGLQKK
jgi:hypothetical protein